MRYIIIQKDRDLNPLNRSIDDVYKLLLYI